jgi:hypothetical protein
MLTITLQHIAGSLDLASRRRLYHMDDVKLNSPVLHESNITSRLKSKNLRALISHCSLFTDTNNRKMKNCKPSQYANYITFKDLFHPESLYATEQAPSVGTTEVPVVVMDEPPRPATGANKWNVVWAEATLLKDDGTESGAVKDDSYTAHVTTPTSTADTPTAKAPKVTILDAPYHHSGLVESAVGLPLMIGAVMATALMELGALLVYMIAVIMHCRALQFKETNCGVFAFIPLLFYFIFELHVAVLMLCDYVILICSVIVSETLAFSCWIVNSILSCNRCGTEWHQYIRRVCHVTRWAFRDFHQQWKPSRVFPCGRPADHDDPPVQSTATPTAPVDPEIAVDPYDVTKPE